jgi:hypothetical protein
MPALDESGLKQRLKRIVEDEQSENPQFRGKLNEKGIECSILIPIFEIFLGFDALEDITYESASANRNDQRFDFLIDNRFLVEAKRLGANLADIKKQIVDYIITNDRINYGLLSNGYNFSFYIQKSYIKKYLGPHEEIHVPIKRDVLPVFTISIDDEYFEPIIRLFSKDTYIEHFERIARYVLSRYNNGKVSKITGDRDLNEKIKELIREEVDPKAGYYLNDIKANRIKQGDILAYENDNVKIPISVEMDGRVRLSKGSAEIKNMNRTMESAFRPMIDRILNSWNEKDHIFDNPLDIIREATGKKKLYKQEQYKFVPISC